MYNSRYTREGFTAGTKSLHKPKDRGCSYYLRIIFFFSSLIQSLIIVSLVLFLVYGQSKETAEEKRVQDLENSCNKVLEEKGQLQDEKKKLLKELNQTNTARATENKELLELRKMANFSYQNLGTLKKKLDICELEKRNSLHRNPLVTCSSPNPQNNVNDVKNMEKKMEHLTMLLTLEKTNFTQTVELLKSQLDETIKGRNDLQLSAIELRREKSSFEDQLKILQKKCKDDFFKSLQGIDMVTKAFLSKIENVFTHNIIFHLSCDGQKMYLEQIRNNCTTLSRDVETKFQHYLKQVSELIGNTQSQNSKLSAENNVLDKELQACRQGNLAAREENNKRVQEAQRKHDDDKEQWVKEQNRLRAAKQLLEQQMKVKDTDIIFLKNQIHNLNNSLLQCSSKPSAPKPPQFSPMNPQTTYPKPWLTASGTSGASVPGVPLSPPRLTVSGSVGTGQIVPWIGGVGTNRAGEPSEFDTHMKKLQKYAQGS